MRISDADRQTTLGRLTAALLCLPDTYADLTRRHIRVDDPGQRSHLGSICRSFVCGYNAYIRSGSPSGLTSTLGDTSPHLHGFICEGASMAAAVTDAVGFTGGRHLEAMRTAYGAQFDYLIHVGAGWALAKLPWCRRTIVGVLDPDLIWLAFDGWGFHDVFLRRLHPTKPAPWPDSDYRAAAYDQGVGRALWFLSGGDLDRAADLVHSHAEQRQGDLFSGLGLAVGYAGIAREDQLQTLLSALGNHRGEFTQGLAFAAEALNRSGAVTANLRQASYAVSGQSPEVLAAITRRHRPQPAPGVSWTDTAARYQAWRQSVADEFAAHPPTWVVAQREPKL